MVEKITPEEIQLGIIGDTIVGKSYLSLVYMDERYNGEILATLGFTSLIKDTIIKVNNIEKKIKIKIWDTSGVERARSISVQYCKNCLGIILVYSINNRDSLNSLENWIKEIKDIT